MKNLKKHSFLVIALLVGSLYVLVAYPKWFIETSEDCYVIERTKNYPYHVKKISKEYKVHKNNQFVPIKGFTALGKEYYCTIEMVDSTFLVDYVTNYGGKFHYDGFRFHVWQLIEKYKDIDYKLSFRTKGTIDYFVGSGEKPELPDTIYYQGLKIYDIENFDGSKYYDYWEKMDKIRKSEYEHNLGKQ